MGYFATTVPSGSLMEWAGGNPPPGWLECNGQTLLAAGYPALFAAIGYTYGGSGASFKVPNCKGRVTVHRDVTQTEFATVGCSAGCKTHTLSVSEMPNHAHCQGNCYLNQNWNYFQGGGGTCAVTSVFGCSGPTQGCGSGQAHNNLQPYIVVRKLIKY